MEAIDPAQRLELLTQPSGVEGYPLIFNIISAEKNTGGPWEVIKDVLTHEELKELAKTQNALGDPLLLHKLRTDYCADQADQVLKPFTEEERVEYFATPCPHGDTLLVEWFGGTQFERAKDIFAFLPMERWREMLNKTPEGWTMTMGEKIVVLEYARQRKIMDDGDERESALCPGECARYFEDNFGITLPARYQGLEKEELNRCMREIKRNRINSRCCSAKQKFKDEYGDFAEKILGVEMFMENRAYTVAYGKLQKRFHPDKNTSQNATAMSAKINAAKRYMLEPNFRGSYFPKIRV